MKATEGGESGGRTEGWEGREGGKERETKKNKMFKQLRHTKIVQEQNIKSWEKN